MKTIYNMDASRTLKTLKTLAIIALALWLSGCNKWLEEDPQSNIGPEQVGDSQEGVDRWVAGVYSNWLYTMFTWDEFPRVLELDNDYTTGPDWLFGHLGAGDFSGESALDKMWTGPYNLINDANMAIRYLKAMSNVDADYRDNAIGECMFQKAFCYFLLVRAYGAIPYFDNDVNGGEEFFKPRTPINEVYEKIIGLLEEAESKLYSIDNANYQEGHVSAASAAALLAKVYATMASAAMPEGTEITVRTGAPYTEMTNANGDKVNVCNTPQPVVMHKTAVAGYESFDAAECYTKAAEWAAKVINGDYGLVSLLNYDELWKKENRNASEFLFGVHSLSGDGTYRTGLHAYYAGTYKDSGSDIINEGLFVGNTNNWYQLFDDDDYRIVKGVKHLWQRYYQVEYGGYFYYPQSWASKFTGNDFLGNPDTEHPEYPIYPQETSSGIQIVYQYNSGYESIAYTNKYDDCEDKSSNNCDSYFPFLRYADVLLLYAEALNELGKVGEAATALNTVRERSNATLLETVPTQNRMRSLIIEERAKELALEGDRRWDLIRWGIYLEAMNAIGGRDDANINKERTERNLLYPIPTTEINSNPYITENNPGW